MAYPQQAYSRNVFTRYLDTFYSLDNPNNNSASVPVDAAALSAITDTARFQNNTTQATGAAQPVYKTAIINGHNVARFSGAQFTQVANNVKNNFGTGAFSFVLAGTTSSTAGASNVTFIGNCGAAAGGVAIGRVGANFAVTFRGVAGYAYVGGWTANVPAVFLVTYNGAGTLKIYKNRPLVSTIATGGLLSSTYPLNLGSFDGVADFWTGDLLCYGFAKRELVASEITAVNEAACTLAGT